MQEGDEVTWSGINGTLRGVVAEVLDGGEEFIVRLGDGRVVNVTLESIGLPI